MSVASIAWIFFIAEIRLIYLLPMLKLRFLLNKREYWYY